MAFGLALSIALLGMFFVLEQRLPEGLGNPTSLISNDVAFGVGAALAIALLSIDVFLPIPSSTVMIACGAAFGLVPGAAVAVVGATLAGVVGMFVGRLSTRFIDATEPGNVERAAERAVERWGLIAVVATRPIPLLAEVTAIVIGRTRVSTLSMVVASAIGAAPAAVVYAWIGQSADETASGWVVFGVLAAAALLAILAAAQTNVPSGGAGPRSGYRPDGVTSGVA